MSDDHYKGMLGSRKKLKKLASTKLGRDFARAFIDDLCPQLAAYDVYFKNGEKPPPTACIHHDIHGFRCGLDLPDYRHRACPGPAECGEGQLRLAGAKPVRLKK